MGTWFYEPGFMGSVSGSDYLSLYDRVLRDMLRRFNDDWPHMVPCIGHDAYGMPVVIDMEDRVHA
jgi:hypothetical protein